MDFLSSQQLSADSLDKISFDLLICVSGYEKRCTHLYKTASIQARKKIALAYDKRKSVLYRSENDQFFSENGFNFIEISADDKLPLIFILEEALNLANDGILKILVDYSCMVSYWYASIIDFIQENEDQLSELKIFFAYSPARFEVPLKSRQLKKSENPFPKLPVNSGKPTAVIIGLGLNKLLAEQTHESLNPDLEILMYTDPGVDSKYTQFVFKNNSEIIAKTGARNLVNYPLVDADALSSILTGKCVELRLTHNVIIVPLGPKLFTLNAYLLASRYPDINVFKYGRVENLKPLDNEASGEIIIQEVTFINEEDEY